MKLLITFLLTVISHFLYAQTDVELKDVSKYAGEKISVVGTVASTKYISEKDITLINVGGRFPNQLLTIVIKGDDRLKFEQAPEEIFKEKQVIITGKVEMYKSKPQIVVTSKEQIILSYKG